MPSYFCPNYYVGSWKDGWSYCTASSSRVLAGILEASKSKTSCVCYRPITRRSDCHISLAACPRYNLALSHYSLNGEEMLPPRLQQDLLARLLHFKVKARRAGEGTEMTRGNLPASSNATLLYASNERKSMTTTTTTTT